MDADEADWPAWRARRLEPELEAARAEAHDALIAAMAVDHRPDSIEAEAAELALHRCLDLALDKIYRQLGVPRPAPSALPGDLAARDPRAGALLRRLLRGPDTRARYVFLEDLLANVPVIR